MSQLNYKFISYIIGLLLLFNATAIFLTSFVSYYFSDGFFSNVLKSGFICFALGLFIMFFSKNPKKIINRRDGYLVVVIGWLTMVPLLGGANYPTFAHVVLFPDMESVMQSKKVEAAEGGWRFRDEYETEYAECSDPMLMHEKVYNRPN